MRANGGPAQFTDYIRRKPSVGRPQRCRIENLGALSTMSRKSIGRMPKPKFRSLTFVSRAFGAYSTVTDLARFLG